MTRDEIAGFLEVSPIQVDLLWQCNLLQRSLHCAQRPVPSLSNSTVYDVLEYALASGVLPVTVTREVAALWVSQLAEADEWDVYAGEQFSKRILLLLEMAMDDGLSNLTTDPGKVAAVVVAAQHGLLARCSDRRHAG